MTPLRGPLALALVLLATPALAGDALTDQVRALSPNGSSPEPVQAAAKVVGTSSTGSLAVSSDEATSLHALFGHTLPALVEVVGSNYFLVYRDDANQVVHGNGPSHLLVRKLADGSLLVVTAAKDSQVGVVWATEAVYEFPPSTSKTHAATGEAAVPAGPTATTTPATLLNGWTSAGGDFGTPASVRIGDTVHVLGFVNPGSGSGIATVASADRSAKQRIFHLHRSSGARVDLLATGEVRWMIGGTGAQGLGGMAFPLTTTALTLSSGLAPYGGAYQDPGFASDGGVMRLTGLVKGTAKTGTLVATLPEASRPASAQILGVSQHETMAVVEVGTTGEVRVTRGSSRGWISLDGIVFGTADAERTALSGSTPSGRSAPAVVQRGAEIVLEGAVNKGSGALVTLSEGKRPGQRLVFQQPTDTGEARIDVLPDGQVLWVSGAGTWVSLAGISFPAG